MKTWGILAKNRVRIILVGTIISTLYAVYGISYQLGLQSLQEKASQSLEQVANALFVPVEKYSYLPEFVASQSIVADILSSKNNTALVSRANAYLENINQIAKVEAIYLLDETGLTIAASNWNTATSFVGQNYSFRPYFQDAIKGGIGKFYALGTTSKTPGYYLSHPVKADKAVIGVVVIKVDLSNFDDEWQQNDAYEVTITDEDGINFLSSMPDWKYRPMEELGADTLQNLKYTRRYDASLKSPLPVLERRDLAENGQFLNISLVDESGYHTSSKPYVLKTGKLSWSAWKVNIFTPADGVLGQAMRNTSIAATLMSFIVLILLYWGESRRRAAEREKAKLAIETAHAELEEKHRQLEALSEELRRLASVDELTGSYNRRFFFETATKMLSGAIRHKLPLSIIVIDVDFFKSINDEYGHHAGDEVLRKLSQLCSTGLREEDVFARLGGEEFVMALMATSGKDAMDIAERLRRHVMEHPFAENGSVFNVTISCGVAQFHPSDLRIEGTLQRADKALYHAKKAGRNQIAAAQAKERGGDAAREPLPLC